uniref:Uncharacterized protein n=1 Tax=Pseudochlorodesmis sp. HV01306a TaxID=2358488 RepID=A0A386AY09_9CHLO|nr:hypothetical protein [Pseudochlorodesmis sp. HV01306a]
MHANNLQNRNPFLASTSAGTSSEVTRNLTERYSAVEQFNTYSATSAATSVATTSAGGGSGWLIGLLILASLSVAGVIYKSNKVSNLNMSKSNKSEGIYEDARDVKLL